VWFQKILVHFEHFWLPTKTHSFNPSVCKVKFILFKKSILYCSTFLAPLQVWHIFQCFSYVNFLYSCLAGSEAPVRIFFPCSYAMKSGSNLANILSNIFIKDIFGCICNSVFLMPTIWRCVVELRLWLTLNVYSLISTVYRSGVWVCSRTLIVCSATRCVKGFLSSTLSLLPMFLLTWQIQSLIRTLIFGFFFWGGGSLCLQNLCFIPVKKLAAFSCVVGVSYQMTVQLIFWEIKLVSQRK